MSANRRSQTITAGDARSPNRAMLRAVGFTDADFAKPIVGIANGHSTMNPCNAGLGPLAERAAVAIKAAGGMPQMFGFPTVTDGISMGTEGMKFSLVSREVIADAIETSVQSQWMDGVLCVGGCDKNMPGSMIALARMNVPGIFCYGGTIKPGCWKGEDLTIVSTFEAVGAKSAGKMSDEDFDGIERNACPSFGACGGMYTANTMSSSFEALGMSLLGASQIANPDPAMGDAVSRAAEVLVRAVEANLRPRDIISRESIENAVAVVMATGGSTNAVLHYLAIAHAAGVEWSLDDFERVRQRTPVLCDLKPSGRFVAVDLHRAGGVPQVLKILLEAGLVHGDCMTITGRTLAEELAEVLAQPRADQEVIRPIDRPMYEQGHLAILRGNLAPAGAVAKITGLKNPQITGPARVFDSEDDAMAAILDDRIQAGDVLVIRYEGPQGRAGHARNAGADLGNHRQGFGRVGGLHHRWPLLRRHLGHGGRPRGARGRRGRAHCVAARGRHGHHRRPQPEDRGGAERCRAGRAAHGLGAAGAAPHPRCAGQVRAAGVLRQRGRGYRSDPAGLSTSARPLASKRLIASGSAGLTRWASKPASRLRRLSSG